MREVIYLVAVLPAPESKGSLALPEVGGSFACQEKSMMMLRVPVAKSLNALPASDSGQIAGSLGLPSL